MDVWVQRQQTYHMAPKCLSGHRWRLQLCQPLCRILHQSQSTWPKFQARVPEQHEIFQPGISQLAGRKQRPCWREEKRAYIPSAPANMDAVLCNASSAPASHATCRTGVFYVQGLNMYGSRAGCERIPLTCIIATADSAMHTIVPSCDLAASAA